MKSKITDWFLAISSNFIVVMNVGTLIRHRPDADDPYASLSVVLASGLLSVWLLVAVIYWRKVLSK